MSNTTSEIKAYVFIAQSDSEYKKYRFSATDDGLNVDGSVCRWRFSPSQKLLRIVINKWCEKGKEEESWLGKDGWTYLKPNNGELILELRKYYSLPENDISKERLEGSLQNKVKRIFGTEGILYKKIHDLIRDVLLSIDSEMGTPLLKEDSVACTILLHWGGGDESEYRCREVFVRTCLPKEWKIFSIGSSRNHLFCVDGEKILIPFDKCELERIENKFTCANHMSIRKILMGNLLLMENGNSESPVSSEIFIDEVRDYIYMKKQEWDKSSLPLTERRYREALVQKYDESRKPGLFYLAELKELFSVILKEGGEGNG